jgi:hypothetical protein
MIKHKNTSVTDSDAVFLGWQKTHSGEVLALYNIAAASHPSYGSTVTENTLIGAVTLDTNIVNP